MVSVVALTLAVVVLPKRSGAERKDGQGGQDEQGGRDRKLPPQLIHVDIRGAMAHVTVTRSFRCATSSPVPGQAHDAVLDLALPERASLLGVEVVGAPRFDQTKHVAPTTARDAYLASLQAMGMTATEVPFEDDAAFRVRLACTSNTSNIKTLIYNFSALLEIHGDRAQLVFPGAAEASPPATRVDVRAELAGGTTEISIAGSVHPVRHGAPVIASETVSTRGRWLISFGPIKSPDPREPSRICALASLPRNTLLDRRHGVPLAYALGLPVAAGAARLPERVLFLIDRSRSVGPGGLEAEREIARRILEALPPATRFDALFFDRGQKRLFPLARAATREAISALDEEMVPARLANGTELGAALQAAHDLLQREASDFGPRTLLVVLSDGAVGISVNGGRNRIPPVGPVPGVELMTAAISVRPNDDPAVSPDERQALRALAAAAPQGGVERSIRIGEIGDAVPLVLQALRAGGDVYAVQLAGAARAAALEEVIAPGSGTSGIVTAPLPATIGYRSRGQNRTLTLRPVPVDARWIPPPGPRDPRGSTDKRILLSPGVAALVEPVVLAPGPGSRAPDEPRGIMERSVVRDALSLAFTPRARACYLNRSARTPADRDLSGRVRLALDLVRGEVGAARVEASTLAHPVIENCLREAAYALDVPRAYRNDDPVTAILNLVFRPRTPERRGGIENPSLNKELDLVVEAALKEPVAPPVGPSPVPDAGVGPER